MPDLEWLDDHIELYAVDVLGDDERDRVESELDDLTSVQRSIYESRITETRTAVADYASAYALAPPDDLRERVLEYVSAAAPGPSGAESGRLPVEPLAGDGRHAAPIGPDDADADDADADDAPTGHWPAPVPVDEPGTHRPDEGADGVGGHRPHRPQDSRDAPTPIGRGRRRMGGVLAAAAVTAAVALGAGVLIGRTTAPEPTPEVAQETPAPVLDVVTAADATLSAGRLDDDRGVLSIIASRDENQAVAVLRDFDNPIPAGQQFQLWRVGAAPEPVSAGLFDSGEVPAPVLVDDLNGTDVLAVTIEPSGGSPQPTTSILAQLPV